MQGLDTFKIEVSTELSDEDKKNITEIVKERFDEFLDQQINNKINDPLNEEEIKYEQAENFIRNDLLNDFDYFDKNYELISVDKDDEPEQYQFEKELFIKLAIK